MVQPSVDEISAEVGRLQRILSTITRRYEKALLLGGLESRHLSHVRACLRRAQTEIDLAVEDLVVLCAR